MDTSKEYVAQCDCEEVQSCRKYDGGDWFCDPGENAEAAFSWAIWEPVRSMSQEERKRYFDGLLWLPRQDQIQEMVGESQSCRYLMKRLNDWLVDRNYGWMLRASMEQLWLAFYMHEKHQKTWRNGTWENIK